MSQEFIPPSLFTTMTLMASLSYWNSLPCSGRIKNSLMPLAAVPMHQHINALNLMPDRLLVRTMWPTSSVFTNVTIGMGDDIHRRNASARMLSWGYLGFHASSVVRISCLRFSLASKVVVALRRLCFRCQGCAPRSSPSRCASA